MLKYIYIILKRIISACKTVHFSLRNGPFCVLKRTVLQCQMVCIGNSLVISAVQKWNGKRYNMNYFYILSTAFSYQSLLLGNIRILYGERTNKPHTGLFGSRGARLVGNYSISSLFLA